MQGDKSGAVADLTRVIDGDKHIAMAWYNRGVAHRLCGSMEAALVDLTAFVHMMVSGCVDCMHRVLRDAGVESVLLTRRIHACCAGVDGWQPLEPRGYEQRGAVLQALGQVDEALKDALRAATIDSRVHSQFN